MARLIPVDDPGDARLRDYTSLRDVQLRVHLEAVHGFFIAEGEKVVRRAIGAGYQPRSFLMAERWLAGLEPQLAAAGEAPCYVVSEAVAEQVTGFHVHRGALASMLRRPLPAVEDVVRDARRVVLLEDVVDHANVGAIARNAAALGIDAMLVSPRCADPLYRRSVKVSMGAVFQLPWTRVEWRDAPRRLHEAGFVTLALTPDRNADDLDQRSDLADTDRLCMILGSEGPGLSHAWLDAADERVRIDMARGIDSLNVAAASAVVFHAIRHPSKRRSADANRRGSRN